MLHSWKFVANGVPSTMFGIRITSLSKAEQIVRIKKLLSNANVIKTEADFERVAADIFPEFPLFSGGLDALNIGIVGQWYSFGPEVVWSQKAEALLTWEQLKEKAPRFFEPTRNPAAIEFWYTQPTDHWYKIYVSSLQVDGYLIDAAKYRFATSRLGKLQLNS